MILAMTMETATTIHSNKAYEWRIAAYFISLTGPNLSREPEQVAMRAAP